MFSSVVRGLWINANFDSIYTTIDGFYAKSDGVYAKIDGCFLTVFRGIWNAAATHPCSLRDWGGIREQVRDPWFPAMFPLLSPILLSHFLHFTLCCTPPFSIKSPAGAKEFASKCSSTSVPWFPSIGQVFLDFPLLDSILLYSISVLSIRRKSIVLDYCYTAVLYFTIVLLYFTIVYSCSTLCSTPPLYCFALICSIFSPFVGGNSCLSLRKAWQTMHGYACHSMFIENLEFVLTSKILNSYWKMMTPIGFINESGRYLQRWRFLTKWWNLYL